MTNFNSATAVKPWRTTATAYTTVRPCHFNSATAVKPWRTNDTGGKVQAYGATSIRPRR